MYEHLHLHHWLAAYCVPSANEFVASHKSSKMLNYLQITIAFLACKRCLCHRAMHNLLLTTTQAIFRARLWNINFATFSHISFGRLDLHSRYDTLLWLDSWNLAQIHSVSAKYRTVQPSHLFNSISIFQTDEQLPLLPSPSHSYFHAAASSVTLWLSFPPRSDCLTAFLPLQTFERSGSKQMTAAKSLRVPTWIHHSAVPQHKPSSSLWLL